MTEKSKQYEALIKLLRSAPEEALMDLAEFTGVNSTTFVPNDPGTSAFKEGFRSAGMKLLNMSLREDPTEKEVLLSDHQRRSKIAARRRGLIRK